MIDIILEWIARYWVFFTSSFTVNTILNNIGVGLPVKIIVNVVAMVVIVGFYIKSETQ